MFKSLFYSHYIIEECFYSQQNNFSTFEFIDRTFVYGIFLYILNGIWTCPLDIRLYYPLRCRNFSRKSKTELCYIPILENFAHTTERNEEEAN